MKNTSITSKLKVIILGALAVLTITGCGDIKVNCNIGALDNYFRVGSPDGSGAITTLKSVIDGNKGKIATFDSTYKEIGGKLSNNVDFSAVLGEMTNRQTALSGPLVTDGEVSSKAAEIFQAIHLKSARDINLVDEIVQGMGYAVATQLSPNTMTPVTSPNLITAYVNNETNTYNGLAQAAVVYGLCVTSTKVEIRSGDSVKLTSNELLLNDGMTQDAFDKRVIGDTGSTPLIMTTIQGVSNYKRNDTSFLCAYPNSEVYEKPTYDKKGAKDFILPGHNGTAKQSSRTTTWTNTYADVQAKQAAGTEKIKAGTYSQYVLDYATPYDMLSAKSISNAKVTAKSPRSVGEFQCSTYEVKIGTFKQIQIRTDGRIGYSPDKYDVYVVVDIADLNTGGYTSIASSTESNNNDGFYSATEANSTSLSSLINEVKKQTQGLPVYTLKSTAGADANIFAAKDIASLLVTSNNSDGSSGLINSALFADTGQTVDLIATDDKGYGIESCTLYLSGKEVGTISYETINESACLSLAGQLLKNNGELDSFQVPTVRVLQTPNSTNTSQKFGVVIGVYSVGIINQINATEKGGGYVYNYEVISDDMLYDILDNNIYSLANNTKAAAFPNTGNGDNDTMVMYRQEDIVLSWLPDYKNNSYVDPGGHYIEDTINYKVNNNCIKDLTKSFTGGDNSAIINILSKAASTERSPFVLGTYMEAIYCPDIYPADASAADSELFITVGRKLVLDQAWFKAEDNVQESTPAFTITIPNENRSAATGGKSTGYVKYLYSVEPVTKTIYDENGQAKRVSGLGKLYGTNQPDTILTSEYATGTEFTKCNVLHVDTIRLGEFKTRDDQDSHTWNFKASKNLHFAKGEAGTHSVMQNGYSPRIYMLGSTFGVQDNLAAYLGTSMYTKSFRTWLDTSGYPNYLKGIEDKDLTDELIKQIEQTYDISLNGEEGQEELKIDSMDVEQVEEFMQEKNYQKLASILTVIMRIIGIVLITYVIAINIAYNIDVNIAGEGDGLLKRITFNRMKSCPGMSRQERIALTERSEKGTYTIHAVSMAELIPISIVLVVVAVLLLVGAYPIIINRVLYYADWLVQTIKNAIIKR